MTKNSLSFLLSVSCYIKMYTLLQLKCRKRSVEMLRMFEHSLFFHVTFKMFSICKHGKLQGIQMRKKNMNWIMYTGVNIDAILVGINFHDIIIIIIQNPCWNVDKIDHETRNVTFNDGCISTQHMLIHNINRVSLRYHCGQPTAKWNAKLLWYRIERENGRKRERERIQTWKLDRFI